MLTNIQMLARHNQWANARLLEDLAQAEPASLAAPLAVDHGSILGILNHVLVTDQLWRHRLTGTVAAPATLDAQLATSLEALRALRAEEDASIIAAVASFATQQLTGTLHYTTTTGRPVTMPFAGALLHWFQHQTHHRGQVHALLSQCGVSPQDTDLLYFARDDAQR